MTNTCSYRFAALIFMAFASGAVAAEQSGPARQVIAADYSTGKKKLLIIAPDGSVRWQHPINNIHDLHALPDGHVLFQTDWTDLIEVDRDGKTVWKYDAAKMNGNAGRPVQVHAFQRLPNGVTMIAESGPGRIIEVDHDGKLLKQVNLTLEHPNVHRDTRNARKLDNGHYLVAHEGEGKVREYDEAGKVVWDYDAKSQVYSALRLPSGNTLIGTGNGHSVIEVTPDRQIVWSVGERDLPGIKLVWITQVARRSNGNTIFVNCHAGPDNPQIIEVTPEKKVVWTFKDMEHLGNATPVGQVLGLEADTLR